MSYCQRFCFVLILLVAFCFALVSCTKKSTSNPVSPPVTGIARLTGSWTGITSLTSPANTISWQHTGIIQGWGTLLWDYDQWMVWVAPGSSHEIKQYGHATMSGDTLFMTYDSTHPTEQHRNPELVRFGYNTNTLEFITILPQLSDTLLHYTFYVRAPANMNMFAGVVLDGFDNPVNNASVILFRDSSIVETAVTGTMGTFDIDSLHTGTYHGRASFAGRIAIIDTFSVTSGMVVSRQLTLQ